MRFDQDQLEWIVREVIRRLQALQTSAASSESLIVPGKPLRQAQDTVQAPGEVVLAERVVATEQLNGKLDGTRRLCVSKSAIVTPAVRDLLKERDIELIRNENPS